MYVISLRLGFVSRLAMLHLSFLSNMRGFGTLLDDREFINV